MSMYQLLTGSNGINSVALLVLPLLGRRHDEYPRYRDCFLTEEDEIMVYTRVGGGNRNTGFEEEKLYDHPNFIKTTDDNFDETYGLYYFSIPEQWQEDYNLILKQEFKEVSKEYVDQLKSVYPEAEEFYDKVFNK